MEELTLIIQDAERRKQKIKLKQYIQRKKERRKIIKQLKRDILSSLIILSAILIVLKICL